ncbi:hypothetical protein NDU88_009916 [Pleurodeles waltl]|uniref:Uncharacterized protein n=1 Tax=Pleurodeles waltl TaxID=8319 RepID=A0AAV7PTT7_PLEWA|nr:hypothetical protein NDU88_009916 [Pleurodeles waltl]
MRIDRKKLMRSKGAERCRFGHPCDPGPHGGSRTAKERGSCIPRPRGDPADPGKGKEDGGRNAPGWAEARPIAAPMAYAAN